MTQANTMDKSFSISWSTNNGPWGWTTIEECIDIDDAINCFQTEVRGNNVPIDATIDSIKEIN